MRSQGLVDQGRSGKTRAVGILTPGPSPSLGKARGDSNWRSGGVHKRRLLSVVSIVLFSVVLTHSTVLAEKTSEGKQKPAVAYQTNLMTGWTVIIHPQLLEEQSEATKKALALLRVQLEEIVRKVPAPAVVKLREVTLWFSPEYPGVKPRAEYHPDEKWLRENRRNRSMAKGVEFTDIRNFEAETIRMPNFTLHELSHAYHDRVLERGFGNEEIKAAYKRVKANGIYDKVERWFGNGRPNTQERAYAMSSPMEYFAETSEAFFSRNDFFPFTHEELKKHDPEMELLLVKLWGVESEK